MEKIKMGYNMGCWAFFQMIMNETGLEYKWVDKDMNEKVDGNKISAKFRLKNGNIDNKEINEIIEKYDRCGLEHDFNGGIHTRVTDLNATVKIRDGRAYLVLSFINTH
jgi:hypothetical protein